MADRWLDIRAGDKEDVLRAAEEALDCLERRARSIAEDLRELWDGRGKKGPPWEDVKEIIEGEAERISSIARQNVGRVAEEFVDALGRFGWEIHSPREVRHIHLLTQEKKAVKMMPRVKRLLKE